jgi:hypothetical protein
MRMYADDDMEGDYLPYPFEVCICCECRKARTIMTEVVGDFHHWVCAECLAEGDQTEIGEEPTEYEEE